MTAEVVYSTYIAGQVLQRDFSPFLNLSTIDDSSDLLQCGIITIGNDFVRDYFCLWGKAELKAGRIVA
jgi:hypothetical protein